MYLSGFGFFPPLLSHGLEWCEYKTWNSMINGDPSLTLKGLSFVCFESS